MCTTKSKGKKKTNVTITFLLFKRILKSNVDVASGGVFVGENVPNALLKQIIITLSGIVAHFVC